jgi:hypothetical protein
MKRKRPILTPHSTSQLPARQELKYVIPQSLADRIALYVRSYCDPDLSLPTGQTEYRITNLYLDSPDLQLLWEKKTLRWARMKARIRTYGERADGPVFVELKRRYGEIVSKTRTKAPRETWAALVDAPTALNPDLFPNSKIDVLEDFCVQCERYRLVPTIALRYDRKPLIGRYDREIRITFDRAVRLAPARGTEFVVDDRDYLPLTFHAGLSTHEPPIVLELKFNRAFPYWMQQLVERFDLDRGSFSKYTRCMDQMLAENLWYAPTALSSMVC